MVAACLTPLLFTLSTVGQRCRVIPSKSRFSLFLLLFIFCYDILVVLQRASAKPIIYILFSYFIYLQFCVYFYSFFFIYSPKSNIFCRSWCQRRNDQWTTKTQSNLLIIRHHTANKCYTVAIFYFFTLLDLTLLHSFFVYMYMCVHRF